MNYIILYVSIGMAHLDIEVTHEFIKYGSFLWLEVVLNLVYCCLISRCLYNPSINPYPSSTAWTQGCAPEITRLLEQKGDLGQGVHSTHQRFTKPYTGPYVINVCLLCGLNLGHEILILTWYFHAKKMTYGTDLKCQNVKGTMIYKLFSLILSTLLCIWPVLINLPSNAMLTTTKLTWFHILVVKQTATLHKSHSGSYFKEDAGFVSLAGNNGTTCWTSDHAVPKSPKRPSTYCYFTGCTVNVNMQMNVHHTKAASRCNV